jgi:hypothetical protein
MYATFWKSDPIKLYENISLDIHGFNQSIRMKLSAEP